MDSVSWRSSPVVQVTALAAVSMLLLVLLLLDTGHAPGPALAALFRGAFGSSYALLSATPVRAVPLALAGLAVAIAFRAGILNVGAEGTYCLSNSRHITHKTIKQVLGCRSPKRARQTSNLSKNVTSCTVTSAPESSPRL